MAQKGERKRRVVATFHGTEYSDSLNEMTATVADVRKFVALGCKQVELPVTQYGVYVCSNFPVEDDMLLMDIGVYEFVVKALLKPLPKAPVIKVSDNSPNNNRGGDPVVGSKRGRVGEAITQGIRQHNQGPTSSYLKNESSPLSAPLVAGVTKVDKLPASSSSASTVEKKTELQDRAETIRRESIDFNFVVGTAAQATDIKDPDSSFDDLTHNWVVYVRDRNMANRDLSGVIDYVIFELHDTFPDRRRKVSKPPFQLEETGWGQFDIGVEVYLRHVRTPLRYSKLLAFGTPLVLGHVIPPNPPRDEPAYSFPPIAKHKKPVVHEVYQQATLYLPHADVRAYLEKLNNGATPVGDPKNGIRTPLYSAILDYDAARESPADEHARLCKIRDSLRELNETRRREAEAEMVRDKSTFFDIMFKEELRTGVGAGRGLQLGGAAAAVPASTSKKK